MKILTIHNTKDTPGHEGDARGAFIPEAINFEKFHKRQGNEVERLGFDNLVPLHERAATFLALLEKAQPFDAFVYLGHGLRTSMSSAQIGPVERPKFVSLLHTKALVKTQLYVTLYACSTGETPRTSKSVNGDDGFADKVRDDLENVGFTGGWVDGHTIAAHATQNPYLRRFEMGPGSNIGGEWLIEPKSSLWGRWRERLHSPWRLDPFRFVFPYLTAHDVRAQCVFTTPNLA